MRVPHNSVVMVADGAKSLFFRNEGDAEHPDLKILAAEQQADPKDGDIKSDRSGHAAGAVQATMGENDFHQQAEQRFAADAAEELNRRALAGDYQQLIVVAAPRTLGEMRKHYHKEMQKKIIGEIAKDLTGAPIDRIQKALMAA